MAAQSLAEFLRQRLVEQYAFACPECESWPDMIERIKPLGRVSVIDDENFDWFLDCLPPKRIFKGGFAFAEGAATKGSAQASNLVMKSGARATFHHQVPCVKVRPGSRMSPVRKKIAAGGAAA